jgi:hypothetical protein
MPWVLSHRFDADEAFVDAIMSVTPHVPDDFGVKTRNVHLTEDGHIFTLTEPPGMDHLRASHRAVGVKFEEAEMHTVWHGSLATS